MEPTARFTDLDLTEAVVNDRLPSLVPLLYVNQSDGACTQFNGDHSFLWFGVNLLEHPLNTI